MVEVVDLSVPLDTSTQVYPGDPAFTSSPATTLDQQGFHVQQIAMGSQTGTHVDAPWHFAEAGLRIDQVPMERFVCRLVLADVRGLPVRTEIGWEALDGLRLGPDAALVLRTGWDVHYGTPEYFDHPYLSVAACARALDDGVRTFAIDAPNLDETRFDECAALRLTGADGAPCRAAAFR